MSGAGGVAGGSAAAGAAAGGAEETPIALVGAGLIGRRHADALRLAPGVRLSAVVDPGPPGAELAEAHGVPLLPSLEALLDARAAEGVILATPNAMHFAQGMECVAARIPALIEKPICDDLADATALVEAAEAASVPLLTGHHRRHNPLIAAAKALIAGGALGRILTVDSKFWLRKPGAYYEADWRRRPGAGPIHLNLSHDLDLLRHLVGEIETVTALASHAARGHGAEDTAAALLRFRCGALGTVSLTDAAPAPWSWELTAAENPAHPATGESCYLIGGTQGSLDLPKGRLWRHEGPEQHWWAPISARSAPVPQADPLVAQMAHFGAVIRGEEAPLVSGREGLRTLAAVDAVARSAQGGGTVTLV